MDLVTINGNSLTSILGGRLGKGNLGMSTWPEIANIIFLWHSRFFYLKDKKKLQTFCHLSDSFQISIGQRQCRASTYPGDRDSRTFEVICSHIINHIVNKKEFIFEDIQIFCACTTISMMKRRSISFLNMHCTGSSSKN